MPVVNYEVDKFNLNGTVINIKDTTARGQITALDDTLFKYRGTETDADACTAQGYYSLGAAAVNVPYAAAWEIEVLVTGTGIIQRASRRATSLQNYVRYSASVSSPSFGPWTPRFDVGEGARNPIQGKRILCVGDSFLRGSGSLDGNGWGYYIKTDCGAAKVYIATASGFNRTIDTFPYTFQGAVEEHAYDLDDSNMTPIVWGGTNYPDLIIVVGGRNDYLEWHADEDNTKTAVTNFLNSLRSLFPQTPAFYFANSGITGWWNNTSEGRDVHPGDMRKCQTWIAQRFEYYQYSASTDLIGWFYGRSAVTTNQDDTHLNGAGYRLMSHLISARIAGGDIRYKGDPDSEVTVNSSLVSVSDERIYSQVEGLWTTIDIPSLTFTVAPDNNNNEILTVPAYMLPADNIFAVCRGASGTKAYTVSIQANRTDFGTAKKILIGPSIDSAHTYPAAGQSVSIHLVYMRGTE